jgi:hypothetical protein
MPADEVALAELRQARRVADYRRQIAAIERRLKAAGSWNPIIEEVTISDWPDHYAVPPDRRCRRGSFVKIIVLMFMCGSSDHGHHRAWPPRSARVGRARATRTSSCAAPRR